MEFKARYEVIGLFTLGVIAGLFAFVYWLNNVGGFGERADYRVRFSVPVSGLAVGGGVYFNGIKVGEVTKLKLDPQQPELLEARISVGRATPVRADTRVGVAHQGLTGVADIMLAGGAVDALPLVGKDGGVPLLVAEPADTRSWTESAARVLGRVDDLIGRNSDRFDGIIAGLERMTGAGTDKDAGTVYDLPAPDKFEAPAASLAVQFTVAEPTVPLALNTDRLMTEPASGVTKPLVNARFADNLPNIVQTRLIQGFENAGYMNAVLRPADATDPDYRVLLDIRAFVLSTVATPVARFDAVAKLVDRDGRVLAARPINTSAPAASGEAADAVAALGTAFQAAAASIIEWTGASLKSAPALPPAPDLPDEPDMPEKP